jgi:hypothetical protein
MRDLQSTKAMWVKGILFLLIGIVSAVLLWVEAGDLKTAVLLALTIWGFCRAYYFAFYVIEKYVDPRFKFAGLGAFVMYVLQRKKS